LSPTWLCSSPWGAPQWRLSWSPPTAQVAQNTISGHKPPAGKHANIIGGSVNSQDVADKSITGADLAASALPRGRATTSSCDPTSGNFVDCGHVTVHLTRPSRVLIVASAMWYGIGAAPAAGLCRISVLGAPFGPDAFPGEQSDATGFSAEQSLTLTNVTDPNLLGPGDHTIGLACDEQRGDIIFTPTYLSAVVLGPS
jgi:hypothetical protein